MYTVLLFFFLALLPLPRSGCDENKVIVTSESIEDFVKVLLFPSLLLIYISIQNIAMVSSKLDICRTNSFKLKWTIKLVLAEIFIK